MHEILFYNKFIICLYMFRALLCSSSGGHNCITQHLASQHSVGGRPVHRLCTGRPPTCVMMPDAVKYNFDLLMMSTQCSKHVEAYNKLTKHYKTRIWALGWSITKTTILYCYLSLTWRHVSAFALGHLQVTYTIEETIQCEP